MQIPGWLRFGVGIAGQLGQIVAMLQQLQAGQAKIMAAMDDLNKAIDGAVAAMQHAASTITNRSDDSAALEAAAKRLTDAASALSGVDPADAVAQAAAPATTDTTTQPAA